MDDYLLHARDKDTGQIKHPQRAETGPMSVEAHVAIYLREASLANRQKPGSFPPETVAAKVAEIRAAWNRKGGAK